MDREYKSSLRCLKIGDKVAELPIIQGGMGVGVSRSSLAGAWATTATPGGSRRRSRSYFHGSDRI